MTELRITPADLIALLPCQIAENNESQLARWTSSKQWAAQLQLGGMSVADICEGKGASEKPSDRMWVATKQMAVKAPLMLEEAIGQLTDRVPSNAEIRHHMGVLADNWKAIDKAADTPAELTLRLHRADLVQSLGRLCRKASAKGPEAEYEAQLTAVMAPIARRSDLL